MLFTILKINKMNKNIKKEIFSDHRSFRQRLKNVNDMIHGFVISEQLGEFEDRKYPLENLKFPTNLIYDNLKIKHLKAAHHSVDQIVKELIKEYDIIWSMLDVDHKDEVLYWKVLEMQSKYKVGTWNDMLRHARRVLKQERDKEVTDVKRCINIVIRSSGGYNNRFNFLQRLTDIMNKEFDTSFILMKGLNSDYKIIDENEI